MADETPKQAAHDYYRGKIMDCIEGLERPINFDALRDSAQEAIRRLDDIYSVKFPAKDAHKLVEPCANLLRLATKMNLVEVVKAAARTVGDLRERKDEPKKDDAPTITDPIDDEDLRRVMLEPNC